MFAVQVLQHYLSLTSLPAPIVLILLFNLIRYVLGTPYRAEQAWLIAKYTVYYQGMEKRIQKYIFGKHKNSTYYNFLVFSDNQRQMVLMSGVAIHHTSKKSYIFSSPILLLLSLLVAFFPQLVLRCKSQSFWGLPWE